MSIDEVGHATVGGIAVVRSARPSPLQFLEATSGTAQCADVDGDGVGGLARIEVTFRDSRSGEAVVAIITPGGGDVSASGRVTARVAFPSLNASGTVDLFVWYVGNAQPG